MSIQGTDKKAGAGGRVTRRRYVIAVGLLFLMTLGYMDRVNFSVAGPTILHQFGLSAGTFGLLSSSFSWTYLIVLIPVGILADRISIKIALPLFIVIWSLAAGITGLSTGIGILLVSRLLMGIGESPTISFGQVVMREWTPASERAFFGSMFNSGSLVGPAVGSVLAAFLIASLGWRASFFILGGFGLLVGIVWYFIYSSPEKSRWLPAAEREHILRERETHAGIKSDVIQKMTISSLLRTKTMWGFIITQGCLVYTNYLFLTFLPLYLVQERHLKDFGAGWVTGVTYGLAFVGCLGFGVIADRLARRAKDSKRRLVIRRWSLVIVILLGVVLLALPWVSSTPWVIAIVCWVEAVDFAGISLNWALASDLVVDKSAIGRQFALVTVGGNILGLIAPIVTGYMIDWTGSYTVPFIIAGLLLGVGAVASGLLSRKPLQPAAVLIANEVQIGELPVGAVVAGAAALPAE